MKEAGRSKVKAVKSNKKMLKQLQVFVDEINLQTKIAPVAQALNPQLEYEEIFLSEAGNIERRRGLPSVEESLSRIFWVVYYENGNAEAFDSDNELLEFPLTLEKVLQSLDAALLHRQYRHAHRGEVA